MSMKQWLVLLMLFLAYLLLGALIFYHIESANEKDKIKQMLQEQIKISEYLESMIIGRKEQVFEKLKDYCGRSFGNISENELHHLYKWDFYNSFYFAYTVVSTIGYGNLAPTGPMGRILTMIYALIGIPINGILLTQLGEYFSRVFVKAHQKYKSYKKSKMDCPKKLTPLETGKAGLAAQILMYLCPGFVMFIFFPAFLFSHYECWTYDEAVYYAFITLTTIGFGDYVAGQDNTRGSGFLFMCYKTFLIGWISFGLGYIVMIMTFIARGMRSKKIVRIEQKLAMNIKHTQSKIWNEFNKELNYLRRVFNELQLSKVRRVYVDEYDHDIPPPNFPRSNSFPNLRNLIYGGCEISEPPPHPRRRANSEVVPLDSEVTRVVSETDLQRIDKQATFATHAMIQPAELLARLVNILGYIPPPTDDDDEPTKEYAPEYTEKPAISNAPTRRSSGWLLGAANSEERMLFPKPRSRAVSEVRLEKPETFGQNGEWTWSGPAASRKIQEIMKARSKSEVCHPNLSAATKDSKGLFPSLALPKSVLPRWMRQLSPKKASESNELSGSFSANDINKVPHTVTDAPAGTSESSGQRLLEETSLADFLRALTALHVSCTFPDEYTSKPKRKLGTAGLTVTSSKAAASLLSLFSLPANQAIDSISHSVQNTIHGRPAAFGRRYSLVVSGEHDGTSPMYRRRSSTIGQAGRHRRFSLRPVVTPIGTPPQYSSFFSVADERTSPPPYSNDPYEVDSPHEPFVDKEKGPGVSAPVATSLGRFSLRPAQLDPTTSITPKPIPAIPRWKAGLLQRQINQKNLQCRARAFSLSDVQSGITTRPTISPLALESSSSNKPITMVQKDYPKKSSARSSLSINPKTVTILSPELSPKQYIPLINVSRESTETTDTTSGDSEMDSKSHSYTSPVHMDIKTCETESVKSSTDLTVPLITLRCDDSKLDSETESLSSPLPYNKKRSTHIKTKSESDSSDLEKINDTHSIFQSFIEEKKHKSVSDGSESSKDSLKSSDCRDLNRIAKHFHYADNDDDDDDDYDSKEFRYHYQLPTKPKEFSAVNVAGWSSRNISSAPNAEEQASVKGSDDDLVQVMVGDGKDESGENEGSTETKDEQLTDVKVDKP